MEDTPPSILGSLPKSRPQHRSAKRQTASGPGPAATAPPAPKAKPTPKPKTGAKATSKPTSRPAAKAAPKPARSKPPTPKAAAKPRPAAPEPVSPTPSIDLTDVVGTGIKAAAELAEIGLSAGARALKLAVSRLPRP